MWFIRRMLRISWRAKKTNEFVLKKAGVKRSLNQTIRKRQMEFLGHLNRHKGLEHLALTGKINGKRSRGRPRITFLESLNSWATENKMDNISFLRLSENRDNWHNVITDVCSRPGT